MVGGSAGRFVRSFVTNGSGLKDLGNEPRYFLLLSLINLLHFLVLYSSYFSDAYRDASLFVSKLSIPSDGYFISVFQIESNCHKDVKNGKNPRLTSLVSASKSGKLHICVLHTKLQLFQSQGRVFKTVAYTVQGWHKIQNLKKIRKILKLL